MTDQFNGQPFARSIKQAIGRGVGIWLWLITALLLSSGCASPPAPPPEPHPRDFRAEVVAEFERSISGWNSGDLDAFMAIYAMDATFTMRDSFVRGYPAIRKYYAPQFGPGASRGVLTFDEFNMEVLSPDTVLVRAVYQNRQNGETSRGTTTLILRHAANHWRIIHDHST